MKTWAEIAADAEVELRKAERRVVRLKGVLDVAKEKAAEDEALAQTPSPHGA